jgi:hypothetical protein
VPKYDVQFSAWAEVKADSSEDVHAELVRDQTFELDTIMSVTEIVDGNI